MNWLTRIVTAFMTGMAALGYAHAAETNFGPWSFRAVEANQGFPPVCVMSANLPNTDDGMVSITSAKGRKSLMIFLHNKSWKTALKFSSVIHVALFHGEVESFSPSYAATRDDGRLYAVVAPSDDRVLRNELDGASSMRLQEQHEKAQTGTTGPDSAYPSSAVDWVISMKGAADAYKALVACEENDFHAVTPRPALALNDQHPAREADLPPGAMHDAMGAYFALYAIAQKCAQANVTFSMEQIKSIAQYMKEQLSSVPDSEKDRNWQAVQSGMSTTPLTRQDCADTRKQMSYMFPPDVLVPGGTPKSPF